MDRLEQDIPVQWVTLATFALLVPITAIYYWFTQQLDGGDRWRRFA